MTEIETTCSFCRKDEQDVGKLVKGLNDVHICAKCCELCTEILQVKESKEQKEENDSHIEATCSFCCKDEHDVGKLIKGLSDVHICGQCCELCTESLQGKEPKEQGAGADSPIEDYLQLDLITIHLGLDLIALADPKHGGDLLDRINRLRKEIASEIGIILPRLRVRDSLALEKTEYEICIDGQAISKWQLFPDRYLAFEDGTVTKKIEGIKTIEPAYNIPSLWIEKSTQADAKEYGYTVVEPNAVIATHLLEVVRKNGDKVLSRDGTQALLDNLEKESPVVVEEVRRTLPLAQIQQVLQELLREQIPIKRLRSILEVLGDYGWRTRDTVELSSLVRKKLALTTSQPENTPDGALSDALAELNALVGLESVKAEVRSFMAFLKIQKERKIRELRTDIA